MLTKAFATNTGCSRTGDTQHISKLTTCSTQQRKSFSPKNYFITSYSTIIYDPAASFLETNKDSESCPRTPTTPSSKVSTSRTIIPLAASSTYPSQATKPFK